MDKKNIAANKQKKKFRNRANWPNTTNVPAIKGKGKIPSFIPPFLPLSSIYPITINTKKPRLQINVIFEKNFIVTKLEGKPKAIIQWLFNKFLFDSTKKTTRILYPPMKLAISTAKHWNK